MFGFGKNKKKDKKKSANSANFQVIPKDFYGAKDPVVSYLSDNKKNNTDKNFRRTSNTNGKSFFSFFKNKKFLIISGSVFLLIFIALASWYYINQAKNQLQSNNNIDEAKNNEENLVSDNGVENSDTSPVLQSTTTIDLENITSIIEENTTSTDELNLTDDLQQNEEEDVENFLEFPKFLLTNTVDIDNDSLTDLEEVAFGTDSGTWDTDGDGYYDGQEIKNLYNPIGLSPMKIIDSGIVREYVNDVYGYRLYYPTTWQSGEVSADLKQVLFSSITGEYIEVVTIDKELGESFVTWFASGAKDQRYSDLQKKKNNFKQDYWMRRDSLVAYFESDNNIYILIYQNSDKESVAYRHVMELLAESFRTSTNINKIETQNILPELPDFVTDNTETTTVQAINTTNTVSSVNME